MRTRGRLRTVSNRRGEELNVFHRRQKIIDLQKKGTFGIKIFLFLIGEEIEPDTREMMAVALGIANIWYNKHTHASRYPGLRARGIFDRRMIGAKA